MIQEAFSRVRDRVEMHRAQTSLDDALEECLLLIQKMRCPFLK